MTGSQRADARRNHDRILAVAEQEVAAHGAGASLEQIARIAGVGSATVRRHFPTRQALLEAVSRQRVEALGDRARELAGEGEPRDALLTWLTDLMAYCVTARGLATALSYEADPLQENTCAGTICDAAEPLLRAAIEAGAVAEDITATELLSLVVGITMATENHRDSLATAERLLAIAVAGISPAR